MPTPFPAALSDRLTHGAWRDALPPHGSALGKGRPFQVRHGSADGLGLRATVEASGQVLLALAPTLTGNAVVENGATVSLRAAHAFLDRLEAWVNRYGDHLTWPATQHGWTNAVRATVADNDQDGLATLLGAFPSQVRWALKDHPMPATDLGHWWKGQTSPLSAASAGLPTSAIAPNVDAPPLVSPPAVSPVMDDLFQEAVVVPPSSVPVAEPVTRVPSAEAVASRAASGTPADSKGTAETTVERKAPAAAETSTDKADRSARSLPWNASPETLEWLGQVLTRLRQSPGQSMGVKQEWLDEQVKHRARQNKNWFEEQLFPAIAGLNEQDLGCLLDHWPSHCRLPVSNPVDMVSQPRFWSILKVQEPMRTQLFDQALPRMVAMDRVPFDERYAMAQHMLEWARRSPDLFRQRLNLWIKWGGSVMEEEVPAAAIDGDVFNATPVARRSVARWILEQGNEMWSAQINDLAQQNDWTLPKVVAPVVQEDPATSSPAPRRFRPR